MEFDAKLCSKTFTCLESLYLEEVRLSTFIDWPIAFISAKELAQEGFYYLRTKDRCACSFCRGIIGSWEEGDTPKGEHKRHYPHCSFVQGKVTPNVSLAQGNFLKKVSKKVVPEISSLSSSAGVDICGTGKMDTMQDCCSDRKILTKSSTTEVSMSSLGLQRYYGPKRTEYLTVETRLNSFKSWPETLNQTPRELAEAGFYHCGISDHVSCFHCDNGIRNWERNDDPWEEHAKWFPDCHFVLLEKGLEFIEKVGSKVSSQSANNDKGSDVISVKKNLSNDVLPGLKQLNLTPKVEEKINIEENKTLQNDVKIKPQVNENRICKICMDKELDVVFLPCSHMITCSTCAVALTACPICRSDIHYAIKALIS